MVRTRGDRRRDMLSFQLLPPEILTRIVDSVDLDDCHELAITCKAIQPIAETIIWRRLIAVNGSGYTPQKFNLQLKKVRQALKSKKCPWRIGSVRRLDVWASYSFAEQALGLINDVWSTLEILSITEQDYTSPHSREFVESASRKKISRSPKYTLLSPGLEKLKPSNRIRKVQVELPGAKSEDVLRYIMKTAPQMEALTIIMRPCEIYQVPQTRFFKHDWATSMDFPNLKIMNVSCGPESIGGISSILDKSPNLDSLMLYNIDFPEDYYMKSPFTAGIRDHQGIKRLLLCHEDEIELFCEKYDGVGFQGVEELYLSHTNLVRTEDCHLEFVDIPSFPKLRGILVAVKAQRKIYPLTSLTNRYRPLHPEVSERIINAPCLEIVFFGVDGQYHIDYDVNGWCAKRVNGCLIRTYGHGDDLLIHVRKLELLQTKHATSRLRMFTFDDHDEDVDCEKLIPPNVVECSGRDCTQHEWQDTASFRGRQVPLDVLNKVYAAENDTREWTIPGRHLSLSKAAMDILEKWYNKTKRSKAPPAPISTREMRDERREEAFEHVANRWTDRSDDDDDDDDGDSWDSWGDDSEDGEPWFEMTW